MDGKKAPGRVTRGHRLEAWRWNSAMDAIDSHMPLRINGMTSNNTPGAGLDNRAFGLEIIGNDKVRILAGRVIHNTAIFLVGQTDVVIPVGASNYVFVKYLWDDEATIPAPVTTFPENTDFAINWPLYLFSKSSSSSVPVLENIEWAGGNIPIIGAFAA